MSTSHPPEPRAGLSINRIYLLFYNTVCASLWLRIFVTLISTLLSSPDALVVYISLEPWTRFTQTLAVAEIIHAACAPGITRSPVFTTFTQVFARSTQVWAVNYAFPEATSPSWAYAAMLLAWSTADVIRYSYFATMLAGLNNTGILRWLRYSLFVILYPVGIGSEWWLMYNATKVTGNLAVLAVFYFFLGLYVPGSVMMYKYMLRQRRKVLRDK
ncbi:uncharacterized protein N7496_000023 [Penicillium cataractarum]|uniref:Very-long-chain (3R)-3-hydroxyacyl-CoA dehydratase n=1 Tax=Penicillium cataractarum TaxID=2100454 RepID=A0A9X0B5K4_9EURO|nr:uncharacterized protein N7496_000023 [Penicillium cataractarum]KAJ5388955.1 hypothetical protein N7496_000023 [Penicillium cataractarum]